MATDSEKHSSRAALLSAAQSLCADFASASSTSTLLSHFAASSSSTTNSSASSSPDPPSTIAYEHGHPSLAPFLGRPFRGRSGVEEYFNLLQQYLTFENMEFSDYVVDEAEKVVGVRGRARFTWKGTGKGWDEVFVYRLGFVGQEDGEWKVSQYEVWADSGSLYLASVGKEAGEQ